ncbi:MAG TPA: ABC transporter ATP-binding protein [Bacillota bacterium]|nr:ABC transporter ATP-binding protein [Bacillota bacterium]
MIQESAKTQIFAGEGEELVRLEQISLTYNSDNSVEALSEIDLTINEGEFVCVLGPSGCGKSTLLKIIAGFIKPTQGKSLMSGQEITGPDWHRGVIFQQPQLYPWLSVEDNVQFGLKMRKIPEPKRREIARTFLEKVGLLEFRKHKPYELSGGMKQRVAIARVLANDSKVLLMDEPFGALDALTREQMQSLLRNIWWETGKTIFLITHDIDEALLLGTRVLVMSERPGRIIKEFRTSFVLGMSGDPLNSIRLTAGFQKVRGEVLNLINKIPSEYQI